MLEDEAPRKSKPGGAPAWVVTFGDLMSLLLCFFVLILSFADLEPKKYRQIAGSLERAFGVQRKIISAKEPPLGISVIAREFTPSPPQEQAPQRIEQISTERLKRRLKIEEQMKRATQVIGRLVSKTLGLELKQNIVDVEVKSRRIVIRISEEHAFNSGSDKLKPSIIPVLKRIAEVLKKVEGYISVMGFTDNEPIKTDLFKSNWDLSAARASAVLHVLLDNAELEAQRLRLLGLGENKPVVANDSPTNRAKNRRVELVISQEDLVKDEDEILDEDSEAAKITDKLQPPKD